MTVSSSVNKVSYAGNGVTQTFAVNFYFLENTHLQVILVSNNVETIQTITSQYTVTGAGNQAGGTVTMLTPPPVGTQIIIVRNVPATQETDYLANDPFPAESHERALDKLTMLVQQIELDADSALKIPLSSLPNTSTELPVPSANKLLAWNSNASAVTNFDPASVISIVGQQASFSNVFTGNGVTVNFTLDRTPGNANAVDVSVNGVTQVPNVDYILNGNILTFTTAPPAVASQILARYTEVFAEPNGDAVNVRYVPPGSGAVATNVQAKLRQYISIQDFGAVGDGVADDTNAWKSALANASQNILYGEKSAIYKITDELIIPPYATVDLNGATLNFVDLVEKPAVIVSDGVSFGNGEVYVLSGTNASNATQLCPVSGGNETTTVGVKNVHIHDLKISTIRAGGNGILLYGDSENCVVQNIEYVAVTGTNRIGQVIACEWAGDAIQGVKHPHNILIENIKTGDIIDVNSIIWLSSVYNVTVRNVYAEGAFLLAGVFTGDLSNDYTVPEQKELVGRNIILDNLCCNNARSYGIRVYGLPSFAVNIVPQSVVITNCVIRGDGATTTSIGIGMTAVDSVKIINAEITGMNTGIEFGQQCKNVTIQGGRIYDNRREGIIIKPPLVAAKNTIVDGVQIYRNGAAVPFSSGMVISNAIDTKVINCSFGLPPETQHNSLVIEDDTAERTIVSNNNFLGGTTASAGIVNGLTLDYAIQTFGSDNYIAVTANYGGITNTPLLTIDGGGKKVFRSLAGLEPLSGTWAIGDIVYFGDPTSVSFVGAVCTVAGTPGTWVRFGAI